jgi:gliding motility-associated lipoprotein GldH
MKPEYRISCLRIFYLFIFMIVILSCDNRKIFEEYQKFEKQSWHRFNILKFDVPVKDTQNAFQIELNIRHLPEFKIREMQINMTIYMPSGEIRTAEHTLSFTTKEGESLSECLGYLCDISFMLRNDFIFQEAGTYKFEIENKWPKLELPGILEVGLRINRSNK